MLPDERLRVLIFVSVVFLVFALAGGVLLRMLIGRLRGRTSPVRGFEAWFRRIVLGLAGLGVACMAYGYFIEPYWPEVVHVRLESAKLPPDSEPIRIVHFSDLHSDPKVRLEDRLPEMVAAIQPDLIVFSGDTINSPEGLPNARRCLAEIAKIAPTFVVKGNWDAWFWSDLNLFEGTGVVELDGRAVAHTVRGSEIWLAGVAVENENQILAMLGSFPAEAYSIFLYHYPDEVPLVASRADLYLAGHTHGGQVALPFYGALIIFSKFGKRYEAGLYRERDTWLYVNRGIGMEGGPAPRVRFWARPEITVIDIHPKGE